MNVESSLTILLLVSVGLIFGISLENTVRSANNGSEFRLIVGLAFTLIASGCIGLYLIKQDDYFCGVSNRKLQVCRCGLDLKITWKSNPKIHTVTYKQVHIR